jgi:hypothetical protein
MSREVYITARLSAAALEAGGVMAGIPQTYTMAVLEAREISGDTLVGSEFWLGGVRVRVVSAGKAYFAHTNRPVLAGPNLPAFAPLAATGATAQPKW